jgi:hypothetical protein
MARSKKISVDVETLRKVVSEPGWVKKLLFTALFANITLIVGGINTIVSDHYAIKNLLAFSIESKQIISQVGEKVNALEKSDAVQNHRLENIEKKK